MCIVVEFINKIILSTRIIIRIYLTQNVKIIGNLGWDERIPTQNEYKIF